MNFKVVVFIFYLWIYSCNSYGLRDVKYTYVPEHVTPSANTSKYAELVMKSPLIGI